MLLDDLVRQGSFYIDPNLYGPAYNVYRFTDKLYKVVHFKFPRLVAQFDEQPDRSRKGNTNKLDASVSRARRVILELALCNPWEWFCTFTLDKEKYDRFNLKKFYKDFTQFIRDQRKKHKCGFKYLLIPELHEDGAWHMHGLFHDMGPLVPFFELRARGWCIPDKLVNNGYHCWLDYHKKFGYVSCGSIRNSVAAGFYVSKYISKAMAEKSQTVGAHLYYASQKLARPDLYNTVYGESDGLNQYCVNRYEFIETGFARVADTYDEFFELIPGKASVMDLSFLEPRSPAAEFFEAMDEGIQEMLEGFR